MNEIKALGTWDILIAVADWLNGFPEAITAVFPDIVVLTCIVHLIHYSMQFAFLEGAQADRQRFESRAPRHQSGNGRDGLG